MRKLFLLIAGLSSIIAAAQTDSALSEKKFKNFNAKPNQRSLQNAIFPSDSEGLDVFGRYAHCFSKR